MSPFVFLLVPLVIIVVASLFLWVRGRQPTNMHSGIHGFQREMEALSPDTQTRKPRRFESDGTTRPSSRPGPGGA